MSNKIFEGFCKNCQLSKHSDELENRGLCNCSIDAIGKSLRCLDTYCQMNNDIPPVPLTMEEVKEYMLAQGTGISYDENGKRYIKDEDTEWYLDNSRPNQTIFAIRNNIDLIDFDEWFAIETKLFGEDSEELPYAVALKINGVLYESLDVSPLDLC